MQLPFVPAISHHEVHCFQRENASGLFIFLSKRYTAAIEYWDITEVMVVILLVIENMQLAAVGINQEMLPVFLFIMLTAAIAWIFLSNRLYTELRQNYPKLYETLGKPKFFMKKSLTTNFNVVRFIFKQDYKAALEPTVIRLCQGLRSLFLIYTICLAGCFVILLDKMGWI